MVVICYASNTIDYHKRTSELSNVPLRMTQDVSSM